MVPVQEPGQGKKALECYSNKSKNDFFALDQFNEKNISLKLLDVVCYNKKA